VLMASKATVQIIKSSGINIAKAATSTTKAINASTSGRGSISSSDAIKGTKV
jgi:hypothetical protein